jgi:hypothetical protein
VDAASPSAPTMPSVFDPAVHLAYVPPASRITMEELGKAGEGIAPTGITQVSWTSELHDYVSRPYSVQPFPLLSEEGVRAMREDIFSQHVLDRCTHTYVRLFAHQLRTRTEPTTYMYAVPISHHAKSAACPLGMVSPLSLSLCGPTPKLYGQCQRPQELILFRSCRMRYAHPIRAYHRLTTPIKLGHVNIQLTFGPETLSKLGREPLHAEAPTVLTESVVPILIPGSNNLPALVHSTDSDTESEADTELQSPVAVTHPRTLADPVVADPATTEEPAPEQEAAKPVVGWHRDSYPCVFRPDQSTFSGYSYLLFHRWVCVVMLSDATTMQGGETALMCADGSIKKVRGPQIGWAIMLQGRYIDHIALGAFGAPERVTMVGTRISISGCEIINNRRQVTSFRAKDPIIRDDSVLTTIRPVANLNELYYEVCPAYPTLNEF